MDLREKVEAIKGSGLFDAEWYARQYPDVGMTKLDPCIHYAKYGEYLGRRPGPNFDPALYLEKNPDVASYPHGPLLHYIARGSQEGRSLGVEQDVIYDQFDETRQEKFLQHVGRLQRSGKHKVQPLVSVIMPTWNRGELIAQSIYSVLDQTYKNFELLVCDDGSTDDTAATVKKIAAGDPRIKLLSLPHKGVCAARNAGAVAAKGKYVAYLDSDNTWNRNFLEVCIPYMQAEKLDCCYSAMQVSSGKYRGRDFDWQDLVQRNYIDMNVFIHRRELFDKLGKFDESLRRVVDWDLILNFTRHTKTGYAPFLGAVYDDTQRADRLTVSESNVWEHVVRNKHAFLKARKPAKKATHTLVSVIVPIYLYDASVEKRIDVFLEGAWLQGQRDQVEVILVYGKRILENMLASRKAQNVSILKVPDRANPATFLNLAALQAKGEALCFLNVEIEPQADWVQRLQATAAGAGNWIVRGRVDPSVRNLHVLLDGPTGPIRASCFAFFAMDAASFMLAGGFRAAFQGPLMYADLHLRVLTMRAGRVKEEEIDLFEPKLVYNPKVIGNDKSFMRENWPDSLLMRRSVNVEAKKIAIKISCPDESQKEQWGDYHFAVAMKAALEKHGYSVRIDFHKDWLAPGYQSDDVVICLRGRQGWTPLKHQISFLWLISHPDRVSDRELERYDHVFVASTPYAQLLDQRLVTPVSVLLQCTDAERFHPEVSPPHAASEHLFIGNSRNVFRPIVRDFIEQGIPVDVYGTNWESYIDASYIKGLNISNQELPRYYRHSGVVLNDHWDTMRANGFMSNRFFDAVASGAVVLTDEIEGIELFEGAVLPYAQASEIPEVLARLKAVPMQERIRIAQKIRCEHNFQSRMDQVVGILKAVSSTARQESLAA